MVRIRTDIRKDMSNQDGFAVKSGLADLLFGRRAGTVLALLTVTPIDQVISIVRSYQASAKIRDKA